MILCLNCFCFVLFFSRDLSVALFFHLLANSLPGGGGGGGRPEGWGGGAQKNSSHYMFKNKLG